MTDLALLPKHTARFDWKPRCRCRIEVGSQGQRLAAAELPPNETPPLAEHLVAPAGPDRGQPRHDLGMPYRQHPAIPLQPPGMRRPRNVVPAELSKGEGLLSHWVGDPLAHRWILELREPCKLLAPTL